MFTGIISDVGEVIEITPLGERNRLTIVSAYPANSINIGASIANAGVCLTVVGVEPHARGSAIAYDVGAETLAVATLGEWRTRGRVNLERALKVGDELGGHMVSGHADGIADILARRDFDGMAHFTFRAPKGLSKFIAYSQRSRRRHVRGAADPAHAEGDDLGRAQGRRQGQHRSRPDGPLRRAAHGGGAGDLTKQARGYRFGACSDATI
jgi:hypothetical protein